MASPLIQSPATISKLTTGSTFVSADFATASSWTTILTFAVPLGVGYEITTQNYIFAVLKNTGGTAITAGDSRLIKANATQGQTIELWAGPNSIFKDIGDALQRPYVRVNITLNSSEVLLFQVYALGTTLDVSESNVYIEAKQVTQAIY